MNEIGEGVILGNNVGGLFNREGWKVRVGF